MSRNKFAPTSLDAYDIANLLGRAGWRWRESGKHIVCSKPGQPSLTMSRVLTRNMWSSVERVLGTQIEGLINKRRGRHIVNEDEWRRRIHLAADMDRIGFPRSFTIKHSGMSIPYDHGYTPGLLETIGEEKVLEIYVRPYTANEDKINWTPSPRVHFDRPFIAQPVSQPTPEAAEPVSIGTPASQPESVAERLTADTDEDAMLGLMVAIEGAVNQLPKLIPAAQEAGRRREQMRELQRRLLRVHTALHAAVTEINSAQDLLRTYLAED